MARLDIGERQRDQLGAVVGAEGGHVGLLDARQQCAELRQVIGADERELLEERVARRQVGEQFDHGLGDPPAHRQQRHGDTGLIERRLEIVVAGHLTELQSIADRRAEQQILGQRQVLVVAVAIERLDQRRQRRFRQPTMQGVARLQYLGRQILAHGRIDGAAQTELIDVAVEIDDGGHFQQLAQEILGVGGARRLVVDPVGGGIEGGIARALRLHDRQLTLAAIAIVLHGIAQRPMLQPVDQVLAHADRERDRSPRRHRRCGGR